MTTALLETSSSGQPSASSIPPPSLHLLESEPAVEVSEDLVADEPLDLVHARALAERQKDSALMQARLAQALLCYGRSAEALRLATEAAAMARDNDQDAVTASAIVLLSGGQLGKAETVLGRQSTPAARFLFALCAVQRRDYDKALARLEDLNTYEALSLGGWIQLQRFEFMSAVRMFRAALELGEPTPDVMINLAYAQGAMGNRKHAQVAATVAVGLAPADRGASANLVAARVSGREFHAALKELERLEKFRPKDIAIPVAAAMVHRQMGEVEKGNRMLRSLRSDKRFWGASAADRAELKAHLALLDLQRGKIDKDSARDVVKKALGDTDFQNLMVARILFSLYTRHSDAPVVKELLGTLLQHNAKEQVFWASSTAAFLELDFETALEFARQWLRVEPFSSPAVTQVQYLLIQFKHDIAGAIKIGQDFLRRIDDREFVLSNTAYAMVMDSRLDDARRLLAKAADLPNAIATRGLLAIRSGDVKEGLSLYDQAAERARALGDPEIALLVEDRKALELGDGTEVKGIDSLSDDARFILTRQK